MDSNQMPKTYGNSNQILYGSHFLTLISKKVSYENPKGKFLVSYITPNMGSDEVSKTLPKGNTSNIVNKDANLGTTKITTSNYIELTVPMHFFYITKLDIVTNVKRCSVGLTGCSPTCEVAGGMGPHSHTIKPNTRREWTATDTCDPKIVITRKEFYKGQKFIALNVGGEIEQPVIIGVV